MRTLAQAVAVARRFDGFAVEMIVLMVMIEKMLLAVDSKTDMDVETVNAWMTS